MGVLAITLLAVGALHIAALRTWSWGMGSCSADSYATVSVEQMGSRVREAIRVSELTPTSVAVVLPQQDAQGHNALLATGGLPEGVELKYFLGNGSKQPDASGRTLYEVRRPAAQAGQPWPYTLATRVGPEGSEGHITGVAFVDRSTVERQAVFVGVMSEATYAGRCATSAAKGEFTLHNAP
jgi:hypothetical protein